MLKIAATFAMAAAALTLTACTSTSGGGTSTGSDDPASLLAKNDGVTDVAAYSAALTRFAAHCTQDRVGVAGIVDASYRDEVKHHTTADSSRLQVMRHLTASIPSSIGRTDYTSIAAGYLVLVEK